MKWPIVIRIGVQLPALREAMPAMRTEISVWETPQHIRVSVCHGCDFFFKFVSFKMLIVEIPFLNIYSREL